MGGHGAERTRVRHAQRGWRAEVPWHANLHRVPGRAESAGHGGFGPGRLLPGGAAGRPRLRGRRAGPRGRPSALPDGVSSALSGDLLDPATLRAAVARRPARRALPPRRADLRPRLVGGPDRDGGRDRDRDRDAARGGARGRPGHARVGLDLSEVFGDAGESPQTERSPMRPRTPYGVAKLAAHGLVGAMRERCGLFACSGHHLQPRVAAAARAVPARARSRAAPPRSSSASSDELVLGDLDAVRDWSHARRRRARRVAGAAGRRARRLRHRLGRRAHRARLRRRGVRRASSLDWEGYVRVDPAFVRARRAGGAGGRPDARPRARWDGRRSARSRTLVAEMVAADLAALRR